MRYFLFIVVALLPGCQKEIKFDFTTDSTGYLQKTASGSCDLIITTGFYQAGSALNDSNYLQVKLMVTTAGRYSVFTDTINGYSFSASGIFNQTGPITLKLTGKGKPQQAGTNLFRVHYDQTDCQVQVSVRSDRPDPSEYILSGSPVSCTQPVAAGSFVQGGALDTSAHITVKVEVSKVGSYRLATATVNGYAFADSGIFSHTGSQLVILHGNGTPAKAGTDLFRLEGGSSSCSFPVVVQQPVAAANNDYFPLSMQSFWQYGKGDSFFRKVIDTASFAGHLYRKVSEHIPFGGDALRYFRKEGPEYFEYTRADRYTTSFGYGEEILGEIPFLKENVSTGTRWASREFNGIASFGQRIKLYYDFTCVASDATVTIGNHAFLHVYKIEMLPLISSDFGNWGSTNEKYQYWYARGVGLIFMQKTMGAFPEAGLAITDWKVF